MRDRPGDSDPDQGWCPGWLSLNAVAVTQPPASPLPPPSRDLTATTPPAGARRARAAAWAATEA
jgi:hypothetical protein